MENQYTRTSAVLGEDAITKLKNCRVAVFGVGGVGGYVAEALARSGVGAFTLVDNDINLKYNYKDMFSYSLPNYNNLLKYSHYDYNTSKTQFAEINKK